MNGANLEADSAWDGDFHIHPLAASIIDGMAYVPRLRLCSLEVMRLGVLDV